MGQRVNEEQLDSQLEQVTPADHLLGTCDLLGGWGRSPAGGSPLLGGPGGPTFTLLAPICLPLAIVPQVVHNPSNISFLEGRLLGRRPKADESS